MSCLDLSQLRAAPVRDQEYEGVFDFSRGDLELRLLPEEVGVQIGASTWNG
jgi:hypothetical protein